MERFFQWNIGYSVALAALGVLLILYPWFESALRAGRSGQRLTRGQIHLLNAVIATGIVYLVGVASAVGLGVAAML